MVSPTESSNFAAAFEKNETLEVYDKKAQVIIETLKHLDVVQASNATALFRENKKFSSKVHR